MQGLSFKIILTRIVVLALLLLGINYQSFATFFSVKHFEKLYVTHEIRQIYTNLGESNLTFEAWENGMKGYFSLLKTDGIKNSRYLTIVDFSLPSAIERLFVIDILCAEVVFRSLCAHGRNSGGLMANVFSNTHASYQSSLGFYLTAESYSGKFDYAMRLDGLEFSNSNARDRAIVVHGADYATENFLKQNNGVLGRSLGCPAVPVHLARQLIDLIKDGSCFFVYASSKSYLSISKLVNYKPMLVDIAMLEWGDKNIQY